MNNVIHLKNKYIENNPVEFQASERLNQVIQYYGREAVFKNMVTERQDDEIQRHLKNMVSCFGAGTLKAVASVAFLTELNNRRKSTRKAV